MKQDLIERIENKSIANWNKFIPVFIAIITIPMWINFGTIKALMNGSWNVLDLLALAYPVAAYIIYKIRYPKWGKQFIEWTTSSITYKLRQVKPTVISTDSIHDVVVNMDTIDLMLKDGSKETLSIEDFGEYSDRIRIKEKFEMIKRNISSPQSLLNGTLRP